MAAPLSPCGSFLMLNPSTNSIGLWNAGSFMSFTGAPKVNVRPLGGGKCSTEKLPVDPQSRRTKRASKAPPSYLADLLRVFGWTVISRGDDTTFYAFRGDSTCYSAASAFEKFVSDSAENAKNSLTVRMFGQTEINVSSAYDRERNSKIFRERTVLGKSSLTQGEGPSKVKHMEVNNCDGLDSERSSKRCRERTGLEKFALDSAYHGKTNLTEGEGPSKKIKHNEVNNCAVFDKERSSQRSREITGIAKFACNSVINGKTSQTPGENQSNQVKLKEFNRERSSERFGVMTGFSKFARDPAHFGKTSLTEGEGSSKKVNHREVNDCSTLDRVMSSEITVERTCPEKLEWNFLNNAKNSLAEGTGSSKMVNQKEVTNYSGFDSDGNIQTSGDRTGFEKFAWDLVDNGMTSLTKGVGPAKKVNQKEVDNYGAFDRERTLQRSGENTGFENFACDSANNGTASLTVGAGSSRQVNHKEANHCSAFNKERISQTRGEKNCFEIFAWDSANCATMSLTKGVGPSKKVNQKEVKDCSGFYGESSQRSGERTRFEKFAWISVNNGTTSLIEVESSLEKINGNEVNDCSALGGESSLGISRKRSRFEEYAWNSLENANTTLTEGEYPSKKVNQKGISDSSAIGRETNSKISKKKSRLKRFGCYSGQNSNILTVKDCRVFEIERTLGKICERTQLSLSTTLEDSGLKRSWCRVNPLTEVIEKTTNKKQMHKEPSTGLPDIGKDRNVEVDSQPLTSKNVENSCGLTSQESPLTSKEIHDGKKIEEKSRAFRKSGRTRRKDLNNLTTCCFSGELTIREKLEDVDHQRKITVLSWLMDSGALTENQSVIHGIRAPGTNHTRESATRNVIQCSCCEKTISVLEFDYHAGSDRGQLCQEICLASGKLLMQCHVEAQEKEKKLRSIDPSDNSCGVCAKGGHLIWCNSCTCTFHPDCLMLKELPEGKWYCPYRTCTLCSVSEGMNDTSPLFTCQQCSRNYHWQCTRESLIPEKLALSLLFCGEDCKEVDSALSNYLACANKIGQGFSWSLIKRLEEQGIVISNERMDLTMTCNRKLWKAVDLFHECCFPMVNFKSAVDVISCAVFNCGSNLKRLDSDGFYTMILEKDDEIIAAAILRFHGRDMVEMPFIGTRPMYMRQGMCRRLFTAMEKLLLNLRVKKLLIPAAPDLVDTWVHSFSFKPVEKSNVREIRNTNLLTFPKTILLEKSIAITPR